MWIVRWFVMVLIFLFLLIFAVSNVNHNVEKLDLVFANVSDASVVLVIFLSFVGGFFIASALLLIKIFKMKIEISTKEKVIKSLKDELNAQRNKGLMDDDDEDEDAGMKTMIINKKDLKG